MSTPKPNNTYPIPTSPPTYKKLPQPQALPIGRLYSLIDGFFVIAGLVMTFWFALLLLLSGLTLEWHAIVALIGFWAVLTYVALPRLHQLLTTIYVPDYFMSRSKTSDGLLGDPINLAIVGTDSDIQAAMRRAGWVMADPITLRSSLGIIKSSVLRTSYPQAPVSSLFVFGRKQDFAFQQEVDGSAAQRHHVRFWRVPEGWMLPGGHAVDWLAAGTFDRSVGFSSLTFQITHKIDANIDAERDYIIDTLRYADPDITVDVIEDFSVAYHDKNGGGDAVRTDGTMPVVQVEGAGARAKAAGVDISAHKSTLIGGDAELLDKEFLPKQLTIAGIVIAFKAIGALALTILPSLFPHLWGQDSEQLVSYGLGLGVLSLVELLLFVATVKKFRWARLALLVLATGTGLAELGVLTSSDHFALADTFDVALSLLVVMSLSATSVREWVFAVRRRSGVVSRHLGHTTT
ncbi:LssY C-terminal domain-containing protein [Corynebacterium aquilae]|uniref:LssY C-terminal domain-containing protein n=1 Tax=Corynebacterium aquilae TaxID=203263 RepID=UPI000951FB9F|nr:LssY C-terminal domain-containing protein [Corynebacterium aquilae]